MELIDEILAESEVCYEVLALEKLREYFLLLNSWTKKIDLVADGNIKNHIKSHLPDAIFHAIESSQCRNILDIGSGGGLPAIPCAILNGKTHYTLCEPRSKRVIFLNEIKRRLELNNVKIVESRIEDLTDVVFDGASARAILRDSSLQKSIALKLTQDAFLKSSSNGAIPYQLTSYLQFMGFKERTIRGKKLYLEIFQKI